jgi:hypothetical protein
LSVVFFPLQASASAAASKALPSGSGPSLLSSGSASSCGRATIFIEPKRRGSLKVTTAPEDIWKTMWSCALCCARS